MKNIGIVTPFRVSNYGTKLQAYAISTYLNNLYGNVEIINFSPSDDHRFSVILRKSISLKRNIARFKNIISKVKSKKEMDPNNRYARIKSINAFDRFLPLGKKIRNWKELVDYSNEKDLLICGSDQIWLPDNLQDKYYTLEFSSGKAKRGAYAASLGIEELSIRQKRQYGSFLKTFDFVSVRENTGRDLLQPVCADKKIAWVCDPTMLLSRDQWVGIEDKPVFLEKVKKDYVFCYFLGTNEPHRRTVYDFAKKNDLEIISVANFKGICKADTILTDIQLYDLSVNQFLYLIHHAKMICTDSMHATIFSIIYEKNFVTFERFEKSDLDSRNSRIYSLLHILGLEDRLSTNGMMPEEDIEYTKVNKARKVYVDFSKDYIQREIGQCILRK